MSFRVAIGGAAVVCCVHDREKRVVTSEQQIAALGRAAGQVYDQRRHKIHRCACCDNLFVDESDTPRLCHACQTAPQHPLGGPLNEPTGVI